LIVSIPAVFTDFDPHDAAHADEDEDGQPDPDVIDAHPLDDPAVFALAGHDDADAVLAAVSHACVPPDA
jgi:hypothetical protein